MKTLRPYQEEATQATFDYFKNNSGNPLIIAPVAAGKSLLMAEFCKRACTTYSGTRILILAHVKELLQQNSEELTEQWPDCHWTMYCAGLGEKDGSGQIVFGSIQSIYTKGIELNKFDLVLVDECFTGDTLISTDQGPKRVDEVRLGDIVYNATGYGKVEAVSEKKSRNIYKVKLNDGTEIRCTGNHPFLSEYGWVKARELEEGRKLFSIQDMPKLWGTLSSVPFSGNKEGEEGGVASGKNPFCKTTFLLDILLKEDGKCHVDTWCEGENAKNSQRDRSQTIKAWWERQRLNRASGNDTRDAGRRLGARDRHQDPSGPQEWRLPELLQGGCREQDIETSNRAGWSGTLREKEGTRPEERRKVNIIRVESVEVEKQGCEEHVYNLQVSGHPSYFANGVLVHNCHLISPKDDSMYQTLFSDLKVKNPNIKIIGYTGTPYRPDSGMLVESGIFTDVAYDIEMQYLIDEGFLCPPVTPTVRTKMSTAGVGMRGGDYIESQLETAINHDPLTRACVDELVSLGANRNRWLIFAAGSKHAKSIVKEVKSRGITCAMITAKTPKDVRSKLLKDSKEGKIKCLVNIAVLTTGYNDPEIDLLAFMRPTRSPVLYVQCVGRGMRVHPSKKDCMILDFGGVVDELGPVDKIKVSKPRDSEGDGEAPMKLCPDCHEILHAAVSMCPKCDHIFSTDDPNIEKAAATNKAMLAQQIAPEEHEVFWMTAGKHQKKGKPLPTMRVTYGTAQGKFSEWICFEHSGFPHNKAIEWHTRRRSDIAIPNTVDDALAVEYPQPSKITVRKNGKFNEITGYEFNKEETNVEESQIIW